MAKRIKFPPLAPGSKVNLNPLNLCDLPKEYALAAAEWRDESLDFETDEQRNMSEDAADAWDRFRREHYGKEGK